MPKLDTIVKAYVACGQARGYMIAVTEDAVKPTNGAKAVQS